MKSVRKVVSTVAGVMLVCSGWTTASASAGERSVRSPGTAVEHTVDRVKTGILPGGGLYSLYSVACVDGAPASLARVDSNARWCTHRGGELVCLKQADAAAEMACSRETVADAGD